MILISCRENFTGVLHFSKQDEIRDVALPDWNQYRKMTWDELQETVRGKRILVLVHGYRNDKEDVAGAYTSVVEMMGLSKLLAPEPNGYDLVLGYMWPGGWARISFPIAVVRANRSAKRFHSLLQALSAAATDLDVQTHSLGARVALEAIERGEAGVRNLYLLASAIDNESVEVEEEYYEPAQECSRVYVMHSANDSVLKIAYRIGDLPDHDKALGAEGPQRPALIREHSENTKVVDCSEVVHSHGGYRLAAETYDYWHAELNGKNLPQFLKLKREGQL